MAYPAAVQTRAISWGPAIVLEDGTPLSMRVSVKATKSLVWRATGQPVVSVTKTIDGTEAENTTVLPITNQDGWGDGAGGAIDTAGGTLHTHAYTATLTYLKDGVAVGPSVTIGPFYLTAGATVVDLDDLVPASTSDGATVLIPNLWSEQVALAQQAAADAALAADRAEVAAADAESIQLPARLYPTASLVTDWNTTTEAGWYRGNAATLNTPDASSTLGFVQVLDATNVVQVVYSVAGESANDTKTWRRSMDAGVWGAWYRIRQSEAELDARYVNATEAGAPSGVATLDTDGNITPAQLPDRLFNQGLNVTDYNTATEAGWVKNSVSPAANTPLATGFFYGMVTASGARRLQTVWEITNSSADTKKWQRMSSDSGATWGAWYRLREAEAELDARYVLDADLVTQVRAGLPARTAVYSVGPGGAGAGDLNNAVTTGYYYADASASNSPTNAYGHLTVEALDSGSIRQEWVRYDNDTERYVRRYNTSTWSPWVKVVYPVDSGWIAPTLLNSWVNSGAPYNNVGYRKIGNRVFLRGTLKGGALTTVAFTLPVGYRPTAQFNAPTVTNGGFGFAILNSAGNVNPYAGNSPTDFVLDGISFLVD